MFKKLVSILSWLRNPFDAVKRNSFRRRWNIQERLKSIEKINASLEKRLTDVEYSNSNIWNTWWLLQSELKGICKQEAGDFTGVRDGLSEEEHQHNVDLLCRNLSPEALVRLQNILNKKDKLYYNGRVLLRDFFSDDELHTLDAVRKFHKEPKFISTSEKLGGGGGYWQWRHYKLPGRLEAVKSISSISPIRFFATVFLDKHGIDTLKTTDKIGDKAIIDAGCWVGDSVLIFREKFPDNKIYSFEPNPESYQFALEAMTLNNIDNVIIENIGLGEVRKTVTMSGMLIRQDGNENVIIDTLDNYVSRHNLQVGLIKTDLEGYESKFLEGAITTIRKQKPILVISIYHNYDDFFKIKPMIESWNLGYQFDFFKGMDEGMGEIMLLAEVYG
jgi:FkbM family methyltransferase